MWEILDHVQSGFDVEIDERLPDVGGDIGKVHLPVIGSGIVHLVVVFFIIGGVLFELLVDFVWIIGVVFLIFTKTVGVPISFFTHDPRAITLQENLY